MEKLAESVFTTVKLLRPASPLKTIYLSAASSLAALAEQTAAFSDGFGLLLVMDARAFSTEVIAAAAMRLIDRGLVYLCAWGPDCQRVEDIFDEAHVENDLEKSCPGVLMTASHHDESLTEALRFFVHSAIPDEEYAPKGCEKWIVAVIGNPEWAETVRSSIGAIASEITAD